MPRAGKKGGCEGPCPGCGQAVSGAGSPREQLGRRLAGARKAAGLTQQQLAGVMGYSRSTVSNAEIGHPDIALEFWARCDRVLKTGLSFARSFDQVRAAERRQAAGVPEDPGLPRRRQALSCGRSGGPGSRFPGQAAEALVGYRELGWAVQPGGGGLELVTGDGLEALELPRAAGMLAVALWLYSWGLRSGPAASGAAAPGPGAGGDHRRGPVLFPRRGGRLPVDRERGCPGSRGRRGRGGHPLACRRVRVPAPPSRLPAGERAAWAHLPSRPVRLAPSIALFGLLGTAAAAARHGQPGLTLPGGIRVIPAPRPQPVP